MNRSAISALASVTLFLASCASMPAQGKAPDWIFATPKPDATNTYFVGSASDPTGDVAAATNGAASNLMAMITQYIGVRINVASTAEEKATLDSYSRNITSSVTSSSQNQVSGFSVKERFVQTDKKSKRVIVYVLASYATADLQQEKERIAAINKRAVDAVEVPERDGNAFLAQNRGYEAVRKFAEAAVAASVSTIDGAGDYFTRDINAARTALSKLRFDTSLSTGYQGYVGQSFAKPFSAKLVSGEGDAAPGVPGAVVLLSYQRKSGTRLISKTESVMSDASGTIAFTPPAPDFVGKAKFNLRLDFQSTLDLLDKIPDSYASYRDSLADELKAKIIDVPYEVVSNARNSSMAIAILDQDESGAAVGTLAQAGLIEALVKQKFVAKGVALPKDAVASMDDAAVIAAAQAAGKFDRVAYGTAAVTGVSKDGDNYLAQGKATVKVLELASGNVLYSTVREATGIGSDDKSARAALYRELGLNAVGKDMLSNL
jgi:hypothetical protein